MQRFLLFVFGVGWSLLSAQSSAPRRPVTLGESLELATKNSAQLKKARLDREALEERLHEARSAAYPQVSAGLNFDYYPLLPTQLLPGELFGRGDGTYIPAQFGKPWQMTGSVQVEQFLYNESLRKGIPAANVTRAIYDLLTERASEEVRFNTAQVFYQTLQTEQLLRGMQANLDKLATLEKMAELQLANGYATRTDVNRIKVARTNLETQHQNLLTAIDALRQTLQFLCGVPFEEPFEPAEDIANPIADSARWLALTLEPESTTEYRLLLRNLELNRIQIGSLLAERFPSLSAHASGYTQTLRNDANVFDTGSRWFSMGVIGVKLKIPIFDGFRLRHKAGLFRIENQKLEADRKQLSAAKALEFRQSFQQLESAVRAVRTQTDNVALAQEITEKMMLQYKEGGTPLTDLLNAQTALSEAETNYWQQVFAYKIAVLKLLKAAGRLDLLK